MKTRPSEVLRAWKPLHADKRMPRGTFWPVFVPLCAVGALIGLYLIAQPSTSAVAALACLAIVFLALLIPAVARRCRDSGLHAVATALLLAPVVFMALASLFVPAVAMDGSKLRTDSAVAAIMFTYPWCMLPLVVFCLLPSKRG